MNKIYAIDNSDPFYCDLEQFKFFSTKEKAQKYIEPEFEQWYQRLLEAKNTYVMETPRETLLERYIEIREIEYE